MLKLIKIKQFGNVLFGLSSNVTAERVLALNLKQVDLNIQIRAFFAQDGAPPTHVRNFCKKQKGLMLGNSFSTSLKCWGIIF